MTPTPKKYTLDGYVIVPPLSKWEVQHADKIIPEMSYNTFDNTTAGAWEKHTNTFRNDHDFSKRVQAWHDRGYRLKKATLTIHDE